MGSRSGTRGDWLEAAVCGQRSAGMKANCWHGKEDVRVEHVPDPEILNPRDAIVKITSTAICGSDLHLYNGFVPTMEKGDILGHEFMGEVVEVGPRREEPEGRRPRGGAVPDRLRQLLLLPGAAVSRCARTRIPNAWMAEKMWGHSPAGIFGYSHLLGGYAGGQAEYARVPFADVGPLKIPNGLTDEQVLFLSDIFPTGYMAAEICDIKPGDTVAVWGCGPVGQFAIAERLPAGRRTGHRASTASRTGLRMAREKCGARDASTTRRSTSSDALEGDDRRPRPGRLHRRGRHGGARAMGSMYAYDRAKQAMMLETDRPIALRQAIMACRNGGTVSVPGVYGGFVDKFPFGSIDEPVADDQDRADATCSATCGRCSSGSRRARSIRASSSRTA